MGLNTERNNHVIGRGDIYFARKRADGTLEGERLLGNTPNFAISATSERLAHYSSARGMRRKDRDVPVQVEFSASFTTDDVSPANLALLFFGETEVLSETAASGQTETFEDTAQGLHYQVGKTTGRPAGLRNITITAVKVGATAKTLGTDYTKDETLGRITIIEGGSIADGADVIVEYDRNAYSQEQAISGATPVEGQLRFVSYAPVGDDTDYLLCDVNLSPNGDFTIKSDNDWQNLPFSVGVNVPTDGREAVYMNGRAFTP